MKKHCVVCQHPLEVNPLTGQWACWFCSMRDALLRERLIEVCHAAGN